MSSTNDPISDLLTRIRNAVLARHRYVDILNSRMAKSIVAILKEQGFIENFMVKEDNKQGVIRVLLKYTEGRRSVINGLRRISKPGLRKYVNHAAIPLVCGGLGISIVSTSKGVLAGHIARKDRAGGELLCYVW
ncbi:MAG: 30S ribosomal protein S8 [Chlamydiales bacterium]|nr:30S ribosomal protein S8 [Chlamydiales bacterium]